MINNISLLLRRHLLTALNGVRRSPLSSWLTVVTLTMVLFVISFTIIICARINKVIDSKSSNYKINIYLSDSITESQKGKILKVLSADNKVIDYKVRSKTQALIKYRERLGPKSKLLDGINSKNNPLPASIQILISNDLADPNQAHGYVTSFSEYEGVEEVRFDSLLVDTLGSTYSWVKTISYLGIPLFIVISIFAMWSTVMLALHTKRNEVDILNLVGASDSYIMLPNIFYGIICGIISSAISILMVLIATSSINSMIDNENSLSALLFMNLSVSPFTCIFICLLGTGVGLMGSFFATRRFLLRES